MKAVGIRELKNRLSDYVRQVRGGESLLVTDRGEVVAELGPPGRTAHDSAGSAGLASLARKGGVTLAASEPQDYPALPRALRTRRAAQLLDDERGGS